MNNIKTNVLFFAIIALLFSAFIVTCFLTANELSNWLITHYSIEGDKLNILEAYVNSTSWVRLRLFVLAVLAVFLVIFYKDRFFIPSFGNAIRSFFSSILNELKKLSLKEKWMLTAVVLLFFSAVLCYSAHTPWQLDEMHTWFFFVNRGPLITAAYYPSSNNHVAYNLLSIPFNYLFTPLWAIRSVSLLSSLYVIVLCYLIVRRRYTFVLSVMSLLVLMSLGSFLWYTIQGRGYVLELAGLLSILYSLLNRPVDEGTDRLVIVWSVCTCWVVPIAVVPVGVLFVCYLYFLVKISKRFIPRALGMIGYTLFFLLICYGPVLVFSGAASLFSNPFVKHIPYSDSLTVGFLHYLPAIWFFLSGTDGIQALLLAISIVGLSGWAYSKGNRTVWLAALVLVIPLVQLMFYPILLFERTWLWLLIPLVWCILEIGRALSLTNRLVAVVFGLSLVLFLAISNGRMLYEADQELSRREKNFQEIKDYLFLERKGQTILVEDEVYHLKLRFYQREVPVIHLLQSKEEDVVSAVAVVPRSQYKPTDGEVLRSNEEIVMYLQK